MSQSPVTPNVREPDEAREALDLIREVGGDDLVGMLLRTFVDYADAQLVLAEAAARAGDAAAIARIAHALKSSARQVGAMAFADACAAAERAGAGSADRAAAIAGVVTMASAYAGSRPWLEAMADAA